jgi:probable HAF family extracellular repeat protein
MISRRRLFVGCVLLLGSASWAPAQVPETYRIEDLGSFGGQSLVGTAINAHGDVAGVGQLADGTYHAFRWTRAGGLEDLGANGGWYAQAYAINDNGDVVGVYLDGGFNPHGFIAPRGGAMQDLLTYERPIQFVAAITSDGRLAGSFVSSDGAHGFRSSIDGSLQDLGSPNLTSDAADINEAGDVTGTEWHSSSAFDPVTAYRYADSTGKVDLGTLGGRASAGLSINSSGVVVGWAWDANSVGHAFRARPGVAMEDLGMLGGAFPQSGAEAINDNGAIVGYTTGPSGWTAFVYSDATGMVDLNTRIPAAADGWRGLNDARAINNAGQIVVEYAVLGRNGTYLLTPITDTVAPTITLASATPNVLTPPDGRMVPVTLKVSAIDNVDPTPTCSITDVTDSEAAAVGGNASVNLTGALTLALQANRLGTGNGRTYTIGVRCADVSGNASVTSVVVKVPHDSRGEQ